MDAKIIETIRSAPKDPGVYIFYGSAGSPQVAGKVLYVGKAANLRARLKSYLKITDIKTQSLHEEATRLFYVPLRSDIEALIEESKLIKLLKPKYNIVLRDDKSYSYIAFTKESFPKVFITHKNPKVKNLKLKMEMVGPFTDSGSLRLVMKLLRRQFPYCTCLRPHLRDCLNAQIGKCIGACCKKDSAENSADYKKMIRKIKMVLRGQSKKLLKTLTDGKEKEALKKIFEHRDYLTVGEFLRKPSRRPSGQGVRRTSEAESERVFLAGENDSVFSRMFSDGTRVECYDNSNFAGKEAVGAMTALIKTEYDWQPDKYSYRKFKIKSTPTRDDPRMIGELITRRLNHPEWPYPDLIIIDGGLTQFRAAKAAAEKYPAAVGVKIISFAKPHKLVYGIRPNDIPTPLLELSKELRELIDRAIYQTHNFVIRYHRQVRNREFIT